MHHNRAFIERVCDALLNFAIKSAPHSPPLAASVRRVSLDMFTLPFATRVKFFRLKRGFHPTQRTQRNERNSRKKCQLQPTETELPLSSRTRF